MTSSIAGYVVSTRDPEVGRILYFHGEGAWTSDLEQAQVARTVVGRKALLRIAAVLTDGDNGIAPELTQVMLPTMPLAA